MSKRLNILLIVFCPTLFFVSNHVYGQIDPLYAQYVNNPLVINPAYTGLNEEFNASVSYRKQWAGFDGSPTTINFTAHSSLLDNKMGVGLIVVQDQIAENKNTLLLGTYSYKIAINDMFLSFGLQAGMAQYRNDNSALNIADQPDNYFPNKENIIKPVFGSGLILHSDYLFLGLSIPRMLKVKETYSNGSGTSVEADLYTQHIYGMASYVFFLNPRLRLKPSVILKYVKGNPLSADVNALFNIDERYGIGAMTRNFNTVGLLAQIKFKQSYKLSYVFELPTNKSVGVNFTTHELTFALSLAAFDFHDIKTVNSF